MTSRLPPFMLLLVLGIASVVLPAKADDAHWVAAWAASPDASGPALSGQTVRQVVRVSAGGEAVRIRLSNLFGTGPVTFRSVHVAEHAKGADIAAGTDHVALFHGKPSVTVAKGDSVLSDTIAMEVKPLDELAVSLFVPPNGGGASTLHSAGIATSYIAEAGDATADVHFPGEETNGSRFFLTGVEVSSARPAQAVVAFGDSITDGVGSRDDAQQRWPDFLAERLHDDGRADVGVVDAGIGGNRILHDDFGPSALSRFQRDALDQAGVRWIVLLEGINDIGNSGPQAKPQDRVTAEQIIDGMKSLIVRAHAKGLKIYGGTLTPFRGASWPYHSTANETKRRAVNDWIRHGGAFDGVVDFDKAIRDPLHPDRMLAKYDSGDHLHPNGEGYRAMAGAIDLTLFTAAP